MTLDELKEGFYGFTQYLRVQDNSVGINKLEGRKNGGFDSRHGQENFIFSTECRIALGPAQPPRPGSEYNFSPRCSAEVKNCGARPPLLMRLYN
jgi:hypothetical protein